MAAGLKARPGRWSALIEIALIVIWAIFAGRQYLDFSAGTWLYGSDYPLQLLDYYVWRQLPVCGSCVLWNGTVSGGWPAFADFFGGHLHPLVILSVLAFGAINASKVVVVASMALAGIAQWWLARVMRLGLAARLWAGALAVVGGHLSGRMDMGLIIMVLSTASASLVLAPLVAFALTGRRRPAIWLGVLLGLAMISGQGYIQLGIVFALAPASLILFWGRPLRSRKTLLNGLMAGGLALLVSAVNLLPLARFWGSINKAGDPYFAGAQPIPFIPLNMVIADYAFYTTDALQKKPFPAFYMNYIGWIPVLLALLTVLWVPRRSRRVWYFLAAALFLVYLASSGSLFRALAGELNFLSGARHPALISPLSVPLVLGLAAWGLDLLVRRFGLQRLDASVLRGSHPAQLPVILLTLGLAFSLFSAYTFSQRWQAVPVPANRLAAAAAVEGLLAPGSANWIQYPLGDLPLAAALVDAGYRVNIDAGHRNASWKGRDLPPAYLTVEKGALDPAAPGLAAVVDTYASLVLREGNTYARVSSPAGDTPCEADARGGMIEVTCRNAQAGHLVVFENMAEGWQAWRDDEAVELISTTWLIVDAPAGEHVYRFRYLPWDALVGAALSLLGWGLAVGLALWKEGPDTGALEAVFSAEPEQPAEPAAAAGVSPPAAGQPEPAQDVEGARVHVQTATHPLLPGFVHVDIELELPEGAESVIDISCQPDGQVDVQELQ